MRFLNWRNRILGSTRFQQFAARNWVLRPIARRRAGALFDLVAGFVYSQILFVVVESGLLSRLARGPASLVDIIGVTQLKRDAALRLLRAAAALEIVEKGGAGWWVLGRHGAALQHNDGAIAMIRHHRLLYADLADPIAILADDRKSATRLAKFWKYAPSGSESAPSHATASEYSRLMSQSQAAVAREVLAAFPFSRAESLLDIGGGNGTFLKYVGAAHPHLRLGLFDLPDVVPLALEGNENSADLECYQGDFFSDTLPIGYKVLSLIRVLHDHDDDQARRLLRNIHRSMAPGAQLIVAEPMAATRSAKGMGDAYFGMYLWAMGSGRPRSVAENRAMLKDAGFASTRQLSTCQPVVTSLIVAIA